MKLTRFLVWNAFRGFTIEVDFWLLNTVRMETWNKTLEFIVLVLCIPMGLIYFSLCILPDSLINQISERSKLPTITEQPKDKYYAPGGHRQEARHRAGCQTTLFWDCYKSMQQFKRCD